MSTHNPRGMGVSEDRNVIRPDVDTTTSGLALVTKVVCDDSLDYSYTGVDSGTGDVTIKLPVIPASAGKTYTAVVVDNYGRVVGGTEGSITGDYILLDPGSRQAGGFIVDTGDITTLTVMSLTASVFNVGTLNLGSPLPVSSGGTGVTVAQAHHAFMGPTSGSASAPGFRLIAENDLPNISWSKLINTPNSLSGYGIADAYTMTESDLRYAALSHTHSGYEPTIASGNTTDYFRGDKTFQTLNTDAVAESLTHKYFSDSLARQSISKSGDNLTYDNGTGVLGFVGTTGFTQATVSVDPTLDAHIVSKSYLTSVLSGFTASNYATDKFVVSNANTKDYVLAHAPIAASLVVALNGLVETNYTIVTSTTLRLDPTLVLGVGDTITTIYNY